MTDAHQAETGRALHDPAEIERHGLTIDEYQRIVAALGRAPNRTELGLFSVMWSEHCSYKSSRLHLRSLPTSGASVLQGPGENAGAIAVGDGLAAVFKIESHNHPSFIEPYQGAATGVGGIIRDIFTMGARPIALLNSLRFGSLEEPGTRRLVEGVVAGIGGYGNSIGIPTVGGEIAFEDSYGANPLVNVLCVGVAKVDALVKGAASGEGNAVYYVGAKTGRDGIHGATMASAEFDERSFEKRPAVQVGDPFMEKLLLEACLEVMRTGALVGIQDMGAAGLTCSTAEMAARGGSGIEIDVTRVPQRETGMTPYEIMLSESQERMLLVVARGREDEVERIFEKWDLHAVPIGQVTSDGLLRVRQAGRVVAEVAARALADDAPLYDRPTRKPDDFDQNRLLPLDALGALPPADQALRVLLGSPTVASKRWVYRQYDHMVRTNTIAAVGMGAAVVRLKGTRRALALSVDGNGRYCQLDPYEGARLAVAEASRNVACVGAVPAGATNCLNFGNPERPEIMWQFARAVAGIGDACRGLGIPITGGNVSLYNETEGRSIYPTPVLGVVGVLEDASELLGSCFRDAGHAIVQLGASGATLGGTEYLKLVHGLVRGVPPALDLDLERALQALLATLARDRVIVSAHDCAEGGLAVALAECAFGSGGIGAQVDVPASPGAPPDDLGDQTAVFGESASRVLVSLPPAGLEVLEARAHAAGVPVARIGTTGGASLRVAVAGRQVLEVDVAEAEAVWEGGLARWFGEQVG